MLKKQLIKDWCAQSWNLEVLFGSLILNASKVQNRAARFVTRNYTFEEGSMTGILEQLKWESLKKRRTDNRLILLYKGLKGKARIQDTRYNKFYLTSVLNNK